MDRIRVFDTTLRDGEQSPGASMTPAEKLRLAHELDDLGVDIIEAGFPVSSPDDYLAVKKIAREVRRPVIAALARASTGDIKRAASALADAEHPRIHVFIATSPLHLERKLRISEEECIDRAVAAVLEAKRYAPEVEFSAEDATRTPLPFLARVVRAAVEAGADTINLPDTVGYAHPDEIHAMVSTLLTTIPDLRKRIVSVHCHNDLGLAVANSLAGIQAGARQVECTVNGIGERAGNAALEEIVMALRVRRDRSDLDTAVRAHRIYPVSRLLSSITGLHPQPNKAVVGRNAFAHEAGIHQDGMLKERTTYEIMDPRTVGVPGSRLILGKHSGRHALEARYHELGHELAAEDLDRAWRLFKLLADQKKEVLDEDLLTILHYGSLEDVPVRWKLRTLDVQCGGRWSTASIELDDGDGIPHRATARDDGPIAAAFAAIQQLHPDTIELDNLEIRANTPGRDAVGEVSLHARVRGRSFSGRGASTDVVDAAVRALLHLLNKAEHGVRMEAHALATSGELWGV